MDDGSYPIAKDIGRVLAKTNLSNTQRGVIDAILDQTYGWYDGSNPKKSKLKQRKTKAIIGFNFFEQFTGAPFSKLSSTVKKLLETRIIKRIKEGRIHIYTFNPNVKEWDRNIFKKRFQKEGYGKVYQSVNLNSLPNGKPLKEKQLIPTSEGLPISKPLKGLPNGKVKVYQTVKSEFTDQATKNGEDTNKNGQPSDSKEISLKKYIKEIRYVFNFWQSYLNHPKSLLTKDRKTKIVARLKEGYNINQCKRAIIGCKFSPYHMGDNDQNRVYDSIGLIFRNGEKIEQFIDICNQKVNELKIELKKLRSYAKQGIATEGMKKRMKEIEEEIGVLDSE